MGIEQLADALKSEAATEVEKLLADAARQADEIGREAAARIALLDEEAARMEAKCAAVEEALRGGREKIIARKRQAAAERAYMDAVRGRCRALFREFMRSPAYAVFATGQIRLAAAELERVERVVADPLTAAALKGALPNGAELEENAAIADGFAAYGPGGRAVIYSTFDTRYDKAWRRGATGYIQTIAEAARNGV